MGREKRPIPAAVAGGPKERHKRAQKSQYDSKAAAPPGLVARKQPPAASKHHSYFEIVDNAEKKEKPLDFQVTGATTEHPGYTFVPIGNPELTKECKELTREKGAMVFIVSNATEDDPNFLSYHVHRTGHKFRDTIVQEAKQNLAETIRQPELDQSSEVDAMPTSQAEYFRQADLTIRDLFPRIPNPDRQRIVSHAFNMNAPPEENQKEPRVGLSWKLTLARRVQLAVLAHIRHTHTRYDKLLRETSWQNARKAVEPVCLDFLVKWRGDDETGRDQLDEILREVVVISDTEDDESSDEHEVEEVQAPQARELVVAGRREAPHDSFADAPQLMQLCDPARDTHESQLMRDRPTDPNNQLLQRKGPLEKKQQRGFKRYQRAWEDAVQRQREHDSQTRAFSPAERHFSPAGAFADDAAQRPLDDNAGAVPHPNGYVPRPLSLGAPLDPRTRPSPLPPSPGRLLPGETLQAAPPAGAKFAQAPREFSPMANRFQDLLVRSIEPASPETMAPAFVRTLPPRTQPSPTSRPQMRPLASPGPPAQQHLAYGDRHVRHPSGGYEERYAYGQGSRSHAASPVEGWQHEGMRRPPQDGFHRTNGEAPRLGDRSNPIFMVDMGGFLQRVPQPDGLVTSHNYVEPQPRGLGESLYNASTAHRVVSRDDGVRIRREANAAADAHTVPGPGPSHYPFTNPPQHVPVDENPRQVVYYGNIQYPGQRPRSTYDGTEVQEVRGPFGAPGDYARTPPDMYLRQRQARDPYYAQTPSPAYLNTTYLPRDDRQQSPYPPPPHTQGVQSNNVVVLE